MATKEGVGDSCEECGKKVAEKANAMQCDACNGWFHATCVDISETLYKAIAKYEGSAKGCCIQWYCNSCAKGIGKIMNSVKAMIVRQDKMEIRMNDIRLEVEGIRREVDMIKAEKLDIDAKVETRVKSYADVFKSDMDSLDKKVENKVQRFEDILKSEERAAAIAGPKIVEGKNLKAEVSEALEREKRKYNLVIMGLPDGEIEDTKIEVQKVCELLSVESEIKPVSVERLGKVGATKGVVRIKLDNNEDRFELLKKAKSLKDHKEYEKVFIAPDLTKTQQLEDKLLRDKLKEVRESGVPEAKINKGQIVRYVNGDREVLFAGN